MIKGKETRRDHIFGQAGAQMIAQDTNGQVAIAQHKGMQFIKFANPHRLDQGAFNQIVAFNRGFDFAAFDAEAANFDLMIDPAKIFDRSVGKETPQIAGAIQFMSRVAGIVGEFFSGQFRAVAITACNLRPTQHDFTRNANRHVAKPVIKDANGGVGNRFANRNDIGIFKRRAGMPGDIHRRLGRAVKVMQFGPEAIKQQIVKAFHQYRVERLATGENAFEAAKMFDVDQPVFDREQETCQHRRHEMHGGDAMIANGLGKLLRIAFNTRIRQNNARARP